MSLAWASLAILLLLLPGVFFFIGLASYERLSREIIRSSVISEVAMATAIAIAIHLALICLLSACGFRLSQFIAPLAEYSNISIIEFVRRAAERIIPALLYLGVATGLGFCLGLIVAIGVVSGPLRRVALHKWIYDIVDVDRKGGIITAYVMTNMISDSRIIMYKGRVHEVFLNSDGKISYIILKNCSRYHMTMGDDGLVMGRQLELFGSKQRSRPTNVWDRLMIDGSNIANVLFDSSPEITGQTEGEDALNAAFQEALQRAARIARQNEQ
jgi:hypothetical protein